MKLVEANKYIAITIRRIAAIFGLVSLGLTYSLYLTERSVVPFMPAIEFIYLPLLVHQVLYILITVALLAIIIKPLRVEFIVVYALLLLSAIILDTTRFGMYHQHILILLFIPWDVTRKEAATYLALVFGITYIFSGIHNLSDEFTSITLPWVLNTDEADFRNSPWNLIPWAQIATGLLLIVRPSRFYGLLGGVIIHIAATIFIVTQGSQYIMIGWNLFSLAILTILFQSTKDSKSEFRFFKTSWAIAFVVWVFIGYNGITHYYFSFPIYSGKTPSGVVLLSDEIVSQLPQDVQDEVKYVNEGKDPIFEIDAYVDRKCNAKLFPALHNYQEVGAEFASYSKKEDEMLLLVRVNGNKLLGKGILPFLTTDLKNANF